MAIKFKNRQNGCQGQLVHKSQKRPDFENLKPQGTKMAPFIFKIEKYQLFYFRFVFFQILNLKYSNEKNHFPKV